jgi:two-component system, response regulator PdtaR
MIRATILIAEDERIIALDLKSTLVQLGYIVAGIARSGIEVIEKAEITKPDLVLMDIMLEGEMNGIEAAKTICKSKSIPIIYITASTDPFTIQQAKNTNPAGILNKPFNTGVLNDAISRALNN